MFRRQDVCLLDLLADAAHLKPFDEGLLNDAEGLQLTCLLQMNLLAFENQKLALFQELLSSPFERPKTCQKEMTR